MSEFFDVSAGWKMTKIHEIINWSAFHFLSYFLQKKWSKSKVKVELIVSKASNSSCKSMDFFQMLLASSY